MFPAPIEFNMANTQASYQIRLEQTSATELNCLVNGKPYTLYDCSASKDGSAMKAKVGFIIWTHDVLMTITPSVGTMVISGFETLSGSFANPTEGMSVDAFVAGCGFPPLAE